MSETLLVSILTPVYNHGRYIEQIIRSALNQTYQNWEWVILDDGFTDTTKDIIHSYKNERIRYFHQDHGGIDNICLTHNKALSLSRGDIIAFIDGDDLWPEYKLETQIKSFSNKEVVLSYGECCLVDFNKNKIDYIKTPRNEEIARNRPVGSSLQEFLLKANSFIYNSTTLLRKFALQRIGGFIMYKGLSHDFPTWCRLSLEGEFAPLPICLGFWRKHDSSVTFHHSEYRFRNKLIFIKDFIETYEDKLKSLGCFFTKKDIDYHVRERSQTYAQYFSYDRAMLLAKIGMFHEARIEFNKYAQGNSSLILKDRCIDFLFYLSELTNYDFVNKIRKLKEQLSHIKKGANGSKK